MGKNPDQNQGTKVLPPMPDRPAPAPAPTPAALIRFNEEYPIRLRYIQEHFPDTGLESELDRLKQELQTKLKTAKDQQPIIDEFWDSVDTLEHAATKNAAIQDPSNIAIDQLTEKLTEKLKAPMPDGPAPKKKKGYISSIVKFIKDLIPHTGINDKNRVLLNKYIDGQHGKNLMNDIDLNTKNNIANTLAALRDKNHTPQKFHDFVKRRNESAENSNNYTAVGTEYLASLNQNLINYLDIKTRNEITEIVQKLQKNGDTVPIFSTFLSDLKNMGQDNNIYQTAGAKYLAHLETIQKTSQASPVNSRPPSNKPVGRQ